jgi:hypothetical protein
VGELVKVQVGVQVKVMVPGSVVEVGVLVIVLEGVLLGVEVFQVPLGVGVQVQVGVGLPGSVVAVGVDVTVGVKV